MQTLIKCVIALVLLQGCAHENRYNSNACGKSVSRANLYGGFYWLGGVLFQQGECSLLRPLKIEFGEIYYNNKASVQFAVDSGGGSEIDTFASDIGCHKDSHDLFKKELIKNKSEIFGEKYEKSSRQVMLGVYQMIKSNDELYKQCWK
jgi:hypothetical protein